ncbi:unnamed protein product [Rhizophagus irregularis]|nr:unnamed protein product [Rhizophagus irregularis]
MKTVIFNKLPLSSVSYSAALKCRISGFICISNHLGYFIEDGFPQRPISKKPVKKTVDKTQLLIERFEKSANPATQAQASNIQLTTLSLISSRSWDNFVPQIWRIWVTKDEDDMFDESSFSFNWYERADHEFNQKVNEFRLQTPKTVLETPPILPDMELTPVDQMNQSTMAKPDAKNISQNSQKEKKSSEPEVTQILTGYEAVNRSVSESHNIIVYDIPYTWDLPKILAELKTLGNTIKCSVKCQHNLATDLGGIPVKWFPASWTLRERKQREKFQAVIHDIPEDMMMATLWMDRKPIPFLMQCSASAFKIIQTSKEGESLWPILRLGDYT